jgi:hypothetical protein
MKHYIAFCIRKGLLYAVLGSLIWVLITLFWETRLEGMTLSARFSPMDLFLSIVFLWFIGAILSLAFGITGGVFLGAIYFSLVVRGILPKRIGLPIGLLVGVIMGYILMRWVFPAPLFYGLPVFPASKIGGYYGEELLVVTIATVFAGLAGWQMSRHTFDNADNAESGAISNS